MAAGQAEADLECPICREDFQDAKMLPCAHMVCRRCVLSWLTKRGAVASCPFCRKPIVTSPASGSLDHQVDSLPTNFAAESAAQNLRVFTSPDVCTLCNGNMAASSYCLQCGVKVCRGCSKVHSNIPGLQDHVLKDLNTLTAQQLAETCRMTCTRHQGRLLELFCSSHHQLLCALCVPDHDCGGSAVKTVAAVAPGKRLELKGRVDRLLAAQTERSYKIQETKDHFGKMCQKVNRVFDDLDNDLTERRWKVLDEVHAAEDAALRVLSSQDNDSTTLKANARMISNLADSAANDALLATLATINSRLQTMELTSEVQSKEETQPLAQVTFDARKLNQLKDCVSALGEVEKTCQDTSCRPGTSGAAAQTSTTSSFTLLTIPPTTSSSTPPTTSFTTLPTTQAPGGGGDREFKVGDRVKLHPSVMRLYPDDEGPGAVVKINKHGWPRVRWDRTGRSLFYDPSLLTQL